MQTTACFLVQPHTPTGLQLNVDITKLNLNLIACESGLSAEVCGLVGQEVIQNPTLKKLTVLLPYADLREEIKEESLCALIQSLKENNSLEILDLFQCQWILTPRVIPTLMDVLLVNFT